MILNVSTAFKILHLSGEKTAEFLQSQLTNDVKQCQPGMLQWQAYCNRQGLVQSIFGLWGVGQDYYILIAAEVLENTLSLLQKYAVFFKITLSDASHELYQIGYEGAIDSYPHKTDEQYTSDTHILIKLPYALPRYLKISRANEKIFTGTIEQWKKQDRQYL